MIAIIDYKAGNQTSVLRALEFLNIEARITDDDDTIMKAHGVIFPGVGAAKQAMDRLMQNKQDELLKTLAANHKPLLGICLGCQILLEHSEENNTETLGIIKGTCKKFNENWTDGTDENNNPEKIRIPHMGWNTGDEPLKLACFYAPQLSAIEYTF
ncbi:MAG: imidazole glycerol phosphate synthase subunit HisH, partial [Mailhella sp.]|nr:imidazole glycerol phosphate synthase subunit HisH [Mailhella sp.]